MVIPQMDIKAFYPELKNEIMNKIEELVDSASFIGGEEVALFEKEFAAYNGTSYHIGCSNGTDAISIGLRALKIGPGDVVLVPVNSFIATAEAVTMVGATVDFIDIEEDYYTIDPNKIEEYIKSNPNRKVKAVIPVHLYGQMADMRSIRNLADKYGFRILEDAAQAQGALFEGKGPGIWGDLATYSFYPGKNLGAMGDAGGISTNDPELAKVCKMLTNHGRLPGEKYTHTIEGYNHRLDTIQAAVLRIKLRHLEKWNEARRDLAKIYDDKLPSTISKPKTRKDSLHVWYVYTVRITDRENFLIKTKDTFSSGIYYPFPLSKLEAYKAISNNVYPVAEAASKEVISIPMYPELKNEIYTVIDKIRSING